MTWGLGSRAAGGLRQNLGGEADGSLSHLPRQSFKDDVDLKQDMRCDTIDTREEYELKVRHHPRGAPAH